MTMTFKVRPKDRAAQLATGAIIDADVDITTEPWTLSNVTSTAAEALTAQPVLRRVTPVKIGDVVPDVHFLDQTGKPFSFSTWRGSDVVLAFIYTRCRDPRMCPLISSKFNALQRLAGARKLHLVEVTLDPTYDRPDVLARYGKIFGADPAHWSLVVGDANETLNFAARFGITAFPDPQIGIIHAENTVLIGPEGRVNEMISENSWAPTDVLAQIDASRGLASNPIKRFDLWLSSAAVAMCGNAVGGFSGLADLGIVILIFGALVYLAWRLVRKIFVDNI